MDLSITLVRKSIRIARRNWDKWRDVFEHGMPVTTNPLLADPLRFTRFCGEYRVSRTIRGGTQNDLRLELKSARFSRAIADDTGRLLDKLEANLRPRFGAHDPARRLTSVLSKVAAFARPERFVAWDRYAKRGLNVVRGRGESVPYASYADYLAEFDQAWNGEPGRLIRKVAATATKRNPRVERQPRFCAACWMFA